MDKFSNQILQRKSDYSPTLSSGEHSLFDLLNKTDEFLKKAIKNKGKEFIFFEEVQKCYIIAGGYARDKLLKKDSKDVDLIVKDAHLQDFRLFLDTLCKKKGVGIEYTGSNEKGAKERGQELNTGMNQGMILIKITLSIGDEEFELDLRGTPDENGLLKDSETRDFSINSIFMDVDNNGKSTFFFVKNGEEDFEKRRLACHNSFDLTFDSDPSRFLRFIRFKVFKGLTVDHGLDEYVKSQGFSKVCNHKDNFFFAREFEKAFQSEKFPHYCQELVNYKILPIRLNHPEKLENIVEEKLEIFRDKLEKQAFSIDETLGKIELRILFFIAAILKLQGLTPSEIFKNFLRFGKRGVKRHSLKRTLKEEEKYHKILEWKSLKFAYDTMFNNSFDVDFSSNNVTKTYINHQPEDFDLLLGLDSDNEEKPEEKEELRLIKEKINKEMNYHKPQTQIKEKEPVVISSESESEEEKFEFDSEKKPILDETDEIIFEDERALPVRNGQGLLEHFQNGNFEISEEESSEDEEVEKETANIINEKVFSKPSSSSDSSSKSQSENSENNENINLLAPLKHHMTIQTELTTEDLRTLQAYASSSKDFHLTKDLIQKVKKIGNNRNMELRKIAGILVFGNETNINENRDRRVEYERLERKISGLINNKTGSLIGMTTDILDTIEETLDNVNELLLFAEMNSDIELNINHKDLMLFSVCSHYKTVEDFDGIFGEAKNSIETLNLVKMRKLVKGYIENEFRANDTEICKLIRTMRFVREKWTGNYNIDNNNLYAFYLELKKDELVF